MKKIYFVASFFVLFFACKRESKRENNLNKADSVTYYLLQYNRNDIKESSRLKFNDKAFEIVLKQDNTLSSRNYNYTIISNYFLLGDWNKYKRASELLLKNSTSSNDSLNLAQAYRSLGNYYNQIQILDSAFYFYTKSEKSYKNLEDIDGYTTILLKKGIIQYNINDFLASDLTLSTSYKFAKKLNDKPKLFAILNQLGLVSIQLNEYDKAINYLNEALKVIRENNLQDSDHQESICLSNIGLVYESKKDYKKAIEYYNLSLRFNGLKKEAPILYSNIIDNLSNSKLQIKDFVGLPNLIYEALEVRDSLNFKSAIIISSIHLSEYFYLKKDSVKSKYYAEKSYNLAKATKNPIDILASLKQLTIIDKKNASRYSDSYIRINDSLQIEGIKNKDRFARIQFETDELRQANTQLSEQNRDILNYFAIAIVFGGFLFFARFQRLKARELALKQTQQQANEEIYRLIISHQNQLEEGRDLEKRRISKELHDGVLGRLFGLRLNLDGLNNFDDEETKQQRLDYLNELKVIEQDLREISHELSRENLVLINNFVAIINNLLEQQSKVNKAKINTLISDKIDWEKVSNTIKINLYRILQEALQNINKHAEAKSINIIFNKDPKENLIFSVEDDGKGYNTNGKKTKGIGVNNIVERVHQCQGKIDIKSQIGKGTKIIITFPLENETINM